MSEKNYGFNREEKVIEELQAQVQGLERELESLKRLNESLNCELDQKIEDSFAVDIKSLRHKAELWDWCCENINQTFGVRNKKGEISLEGKPGQSFKEIVEAALTAEKEDKI